MIDYAIGFYNEYIFLFYLIIFFLVILEGPIVILTLTLFSAKLGIPLYFLIILALIGDFGGDFLHFLAGRFFKEKFLRKNKFEKIKSFKDKIDNLPLLEKLIIIKYTPPITSIGLIYLGVSNIKTKDFIKYDFILSAISSLIVVFIGYNFSEYFKDFDNLGYLFLALGFAIFILVITTKVFAKFVLNKIYKKYDS